MSSQPPSKLLAWCRLLRLPNLPTAIADVFAGACVVHPLWAKDVPWDGASTALAVIAGSALYLSGMVFNDIFDVEIDRVERPFRPLPSGAISIRAARRVGWGLVALGLACSLTVGWQILAVALALTAAIFAYDGWLKKYWFGPIGMGLCRFLNFLLGAATVSLPAISRAYPDRNPVFILAAANGIYVLGLTIIARGEAARGRRPLILLGAFVVLVGLFLHSDATPLPPLPILFSLSQFSKNNAGMVVCGVLLILALIYGRCLIDPSPKKTQFAVKWSILLLILLDARVAWAVERIDWAICIVCLLPVSLVLGRKVYST